MDYKQIFCGAVATAYFIWVAKCWWTTDRDALRFQRGVWCVLLAAIVLVYVYTFGVLQGGRATLHDVASAMHWNLEKMLEDAGPDIPEHHLFFNDVLVPGWVTFYVFVLWAEISLALTMPDRKRSHRQASEEHRQGNGDRPSADPDGSS